MKKHNLTKDEKKQHVERRNARKGKRTMWQEKGE